jgi:hypothetical protein
VVDGHGKTDQLDLQPCLVDHRFLVISPVRHRSWVVWGCVLVVLAPCRWPCLFLNFAVIEYQAGKWFKMRDADCAESVVEC